MEPIIRLLQTASPEEIDELFDAVFAAQRRLHPDWIITYSIIRKDVPDPAEETDRKAASLFSP